MRLTGVSLKSRRQRSSKGERKWDFSVEAKAARAVLAGVVGETPGRVGRREAAGAALAVGQESVGSNTRIMSITRVGRTAAYLIINPADQSKRGASNVKTICC
jgi:hypothetical protein